jgi:ferredoxin
MRITADRKVCVGGGMCVLAAPDVFDQDANGIVRLLDEDPPDNGTIRRAVSLCPSGALRVVQGAPS